MSRGISRGNCPPYFLRQTCTIKFVARVICISLITSFFWIQINKKDLPSPENLAEEAIQNVGNNFRYAELYRKISRLSKDLKYILLWTRKDFAPFYFFGSGQRKFVQNNCSVFNCFITDDRNFFGGDLKKFDAVAFNGRNLGQYTKQSDLPQSRAPRQKYIFFNMESAVNYPICNPIFDKFFNWTSTYRLDSDVPYSNILIRNIDGKVVGPKLKMNWFQENLINEPDTDEELYNRLKNKNKAVAWFVSNCKAKSGRKEFVEKLQKALDQYGLKVDIYGSCGNLTCPRHRQSDCDAMLERDYYFYLAMENSLAEDYVTEKVLTALQNNAVPIVFGGADYDRFLPPHSYLNARLQSPEELASTMNSLIKSPKEYSRFFTWKNHYTYHNSEAVENVCSVCAALNNKNMVEKTTLYENFRSWWTPNYKQLCMTMKEMNDYHL